MPSREPKCKTTEPDPEKLKTFTSLKLDWINRINSDRRLSDYQSRAGVSLSFYFNHNAYDCYVGQNTLAERAGGEKRATQYALDALVALGYLGVTLRAGPNGTNIYRMMFPEAEESDQHVHADAPPEPPPVHVDAPPPCTEMHHPHAPPCAQTPVLEHLCMNTCAESISINRSSGGGRPVKQLTLDVYQPKKDISEPKDIGQSKDPQSPENGFDEFWKHYPRKKSKGDARKAYISAVKNKKATPSELIAGAMRYAQERTGQDQKFTKHGSSWLNAECWLDEPATAVGTKTARPAKLTTADSAIAGMARFLNRGEKTI